MAKPLRIGSMIDIDKPLADAVAQLQRYRRRRARPRLRRRRSSGPTR